LKKGIVIVGSGFVVFSIIALIFLNNIFIFNPLFFHHNVVTYNNWSDYRYPAKIEYLSWSGHKGWKLKKTVHNKKEIRFIFGELKDNLNGMRSNQNDYIKNANGREMKVIVRRSDGRILLQFDFYEGSNIAKVGDGGFIQMPHDLKEHLLKRIAD
jgi:hypothetical protein